MKTTASAVAFFLAAQAVFAQLAPGTVDMSFDAGSSITEPVYASAVLQDGKVLVAGYFHAVNGSAAPGVARLLGNGLTDLAFATNSLQWSVLSEAEGTVTNVLPWGLWPYAECMAVQLDGKILMGGDFWNPDSYWDEGLVRLNPDGAWDDTFPLPLPPPVYALAVQRDGKVLAGGGFSVAGRSRIVRLNADGSIDETFLYGLSGANNTVRSVAVLNDGKILIGGYFTAVNGSPRNGVARLNADGSLDNTFVPNVTEVNVLAPQADGKVVIGGNFTVVNGAGRNRLARLNPDGSLDNAFLSGQSGADGLVLALSVQSDGRILVGGEFTSINGTSRPRLARLTTSGSVDSAFSSGPGGFDGTVRSITLQTNGQILVTGDFVSVGGVPQNRVARLGTTGSLDTAFRNGPVVFTRGVTSVAIQTDGKILANSVAGTGIARFNTNGVPDSSFLSGLAGANGNVNALAALTSGKILVAGEFTQFNGVPSRALVRLSSNGAVDPTFQNGIGGSGYVNCLKLQADGKILIAGSFTDVKGTARTNLARLTADGAVDFTFLSGQAGVNGEVFSLAVQPDGKILVGGTFTQVNGVGRANIARLNADGSLDRSFREGVNGPDGPVYTITVLPDTNVLLSGFFSLTNQTGFRTRDVARLLAKDGSTDTNFFVPYTLSEVLGVRALALQPDGRILIGGDFWLVSGTIVNYIARLGRDGGGEGFLARPLGADDPVTALAIVDGKNVLVGGSFGTFNSAPRSYLARLAYNLPSVPLEVALNNSELQWTNDPVVPWQGQTFVSHDGVAAAQTGAIGSSQSNSLHTVVVGPGCLSFWWKVSSEAGYDFLTFTCTGPGLTNQLRISGESDWQQQTVCVPAGTYTVRWTYSKDYVFTSGADAGWVDEVSFTPGNLAPIITLNPLSSTNYAGDSVFFTADGTGIAPLSYQWLHNGVEIPSATNSNYLAESVVPEQAGTYSLRISNPNGATFSAGAQLVVIPVRATGADDYGQATVTMSTIDAIAIAAGQYHSMILRRDGSIYAWGNDGSRQCSVPAGLGPATAIAAGGYHSLAVKSDGTVVGWGHNYYGQASPPPGLSNVLAVAAGMWHSLALKADGTVVGWGDPAFEKSKTPASLTNIIAIAAGGDHSLALRADGRVEAWGKNLGPSGSYAGQAAVPLGLQQQVVVAIGAGEFHSLAVKSDGSIVGWGDNSRGQLTVPTNLPPAIAVAGGGAHTVAVFGDGTAAGWGENYDGQINIPRTVTNIVAIAAGHAHSLALFGQRPPPPQIQTPARSGNEFSVQVSTVVGKLYALEYVPSITASNWTSLPAVRGTGRAVSLTDPTASAAQRYYRVRQW